MAKSKAYMSEYRKSIAMQKQQAQPAQREEPEEKKRVASKSVAKGQKVSSVKPNEQYQIFVYENGKERPYTDKNGNMQYRSGAQIANKMIYNPNREAWESKAQKQEQAKKSGLGKIRKYIIRKRK